MLHVGLDLSRTRLDVHAMDESGTSMVMTTAAPDACKTDKIDAWVLAGLSRRDLVPAIWLPTPGVRGERERARWRLHLVRHRTALKNRIHATLLAFGHPCPVSDLFGVTGRRLLEGLGLPEPWAGGRECRAAADRHPRWRDRRLRGCAAPGSAPTTP